MAESKNNFLKGRMNKDLDERLLQKGEYRDARNVSISSSDTGSSGTLESVAGNVEIASFSLTDRNLEIIGKFADIANNRIICFITNYTDSSSTTQDNFAPSASAHYITYYDTRSGNSGVLVQGNFLNFSKTHRIIQANVLEDLLFWTDNRNQPRKINVESAIGSSSQISSNPYYFKEEHISVAKYYPYNSIRLYDKTSTGKLNNYNHSLFDNITEIFDTATLANSTTYTVSVPSGSTPESSTSGSGTGATIKLTTDSGGNVEEIEVTSGGSGFDIGDTITFVDPTGVTSDEMVVVINEEDLWIEPTMKDTTSLLLPYSIEAGFNNTVSSTNHAITRTDATKDPEKFEGCLFYVTNSSGEITVEIDVDNPIVSIVQDSGNVYDIVLTNSIEVSNTDTIHIGANPYYNADDIDTISNIRDKFVRFSYRFKYDDNEYSLIAPFTQSTFISKQDGYFLGDSTDIDKDEQSTIKSSNVDFFENSVTEVGLVIDLPEGIDSVSDLFYELKVKEVDILYKDANESSIKVVKTLKENDIVSDSSSELSYTYKSTKPVKVLPESDVVRVFDKIPVRAKAQEVIANRVVYANYIESFAPPESLDYRASYGEKGYQYEYGDAYSRREYPHHTLKQNRTYQVGIILCDKFGRKSSPIMSDNSTVFSKYKGTAFDLISDIDVYMGDALRVTFNESIPLESSSQMYKGIYDADTNPMGWYSYQVVVKQKEQSYYNAYIPSILNGYPKNTSDISNNLSHITLIGDNINKIPRDFESSSELDGVYRSKVQVYPRVTNNVYSTKHSSELFTDYTSPNKITLIGSRDDLGLNLTEDGVKYNISPFYSIPDVFDPASSDLLNRGGNPLIARMSTKGAIGSEGGNAVISDDISYDNLRLNVIETRPTESNLELFWETSTSGLVSDINTEILVPANSDGLPYKLSGFEFTFAEDSEFNDYISTEFTVQDFSGNDLNTADIANTFITVKNKNNQSYVNFFVVEKNGSNNFRLKLNTSFVPYYGENSWRENIYDIVMGFSNVVNGQTVSRNIVVKDNAMINKEPTFDEDGTNLGSVLSVVGTYNSGSSLSPIPLGSEWQSVSNLEVSNGAGDFFESRNEIDYRVDRVEWYNTNDSLWYDYWYLGRFGKGTGARFSRDPNALVKILIPSNSSLSAKMVYSPVLQWGFFNQSPWSPSVFSGLPISNWVESEYSGEAPTLLKNYELLDESIYSTNLFAYLSNTDSLLNNYVSSGGVITAGGLSETSQLYVSQRDFYALARTHRNITSQPVLTDDMQVRVTFTLFDANQNGISKQFTALFDVEYGGYPTFDDTI